MTTPYQARAVLRGLLLEAAAAAVGEPHAVVAFDPGPTGAGALSDGLSATVTSRIRVEIGDPVPGKADRIAAARRYLTTQGWSIIRSSRSDALDELVAVRDGYTIAVTHHTGEARLIMLGETPALPD